MTHPQKSQDVTPTVFCWFSKSLKLVRSQEERNSTLPFNGRSSIEFVVESWTWRIGTYKLWCWRRHLRVPWTARRSNQSILKEINLEYSLEGVMPNLKLQYCGHLDANSQLIGKDPNAGKYWEREEKGATENEMVGWHHRLNGHAFEETPGDGEGQGSLVCCSPWGHKGSYIT